MYFPSPTLPRSPVLFYVRHCDGGFLILSSEGSKAIREEAKIDGWKVRGNAREVEMYLE